MTLSSGALSGLTMNGAPIQTGPNGGRLGEGSLSALFNLRDTLAPEAQTKIDAIARDMIERVTDPTVDPTLAPGMTGLFTDRGNAFDPLDEVGLAERIRLNTSVVPEQGAGSGGLSDRLTALAAALGERRVQASGGLSAGARSLAEFASEVVSSQSSQRLSAETGTAFATARRDALKSEMLKDGVDTDQEMQNLLLIEKAYAANAKVIQTVDEMINVLLGL
jgi:flagellar hook-associated protein 1 FlgK